jgi:hypothetical protein
MLVIPAFGRLRQEDGEFKASLDYIVTPCLKAGITTHLSILTLNVNGLNFPIKRQQLANWIKKEDSTICCLQETHLIDKKQTLP